MKMMEFDKTTGEKFRETGGPENQREPWILTRLMLLTFVVAGILIYPCEGGAFERDFKTAAKENSAMVFAQKAQNNNEQTLPNQKVPPSRTETATFGLG